MYELYLVGQAREKFNTSAKRKMRAKGWDMKVLAAELGRTPESIYSFFAHKDRPMRFLAAEIATKLEMTRKDWT